VISEKAGVVRVDVYVQPRASRSQVVGEHGDALKIRLAAPPVDGAANDELIRFMAKTLGVAQSQVTIASGATSRRKTIEIQGSTIDKVSHALRPTGA
jgi:uncharacterized protein